MYIVDLSIYFHDKRDYFAIIGTFTLVVKIHDVNNKKIRDGNPSDILGENWSLFA